MSEAPGAREHHPKTRQRKGTAPVATHVTHPAGQPRSDQEWN